MLKSFAAVLCTAAAAFGQYKMEPVGAPPAELAPAVAGVLNKQGARILGANGSVFCEVWLRSSVPAGPKSNEESVTLPTIPHGSVLGAIRFPAAGADRRGQVIKPGVYTLRFSYYPLNGDHQGAAPQRDFMVMTPAAEDKDPAPIPVFDALMVMSRKASNTPHPAVLSFWKAETDFQPGFAKMGEQDWVWQTKLGEMPVAIILVGKTEA